MAWPALVWGVATLLAGCGRASPPPSGTPSESPPLSSPAPAAACGDAPADAACGSGSASGAAPGTSWATALETLRVRDVNTGREALVRLYAPDGTFDEGAARAIDHIVAREEPPQRGGAPRRSGARPGAPGGTTVAAAAEDAGAAPPRPLDRRLLRLVVKAAHHFRAQEVVVISAFRDSRRKGSRHKSGEALDFQLPGVEAAALASHLRGYARVGVGIYTHPRTQYVHLDVRDASTHWLDASPPGRTWPEQPLADPDAPARDARYRPEDDLPIAPPR